MTAVILVSVPDLTSSITWDDLLCLSPFDSFIQKKEIAKEDKRRRGSCDCLTWRRLPVNVYKYLKEWCQKGFSQALFTGAPCQTQEQWAPTETQEVLSEHKNTWFLL